MGTGSSFGGVKRPGRVVTHSRLLLKLRMSGVFPPLHFVCLHEVYRDNFNLHLRLDLPSGIICSGFSTETLNAFRLSHMLATCPSHPSHPPCFERPNSWREVQVMKLKFMQLYPPSNYVLSLGPNIFLNTPSFSTRRTPNTFVPDFTFQSRVDNFSTLK